MFHRLLASLKALLCIWIGISIMHVIKIPILSVLDLPASSQARVASPTRQPDLATLSKNPFFPFQKSVVNATLKKQLEKNWILRGTVVADSATWAVLEDKATGEQQLVQQGEAFGESQVTQISRNRVQLKNLNRGTELVLSLEESQTNPLIQSEMKVAQSEPIELPEDVAQVSKLEYVIKRNLLKNLVQKIPTLVQTLELILFELDAGPQGYLVSAGPQLMKVAPIGLEDGDLLRKVNGKPLTSESAILNIFKNLSRETEIKIEIDRDDQILEFTYHVQP